MGAGSACGLSLQDTQASALEKPSDFCGNVRSEAFGLGVWHPVASGDASLPSSLALGPPVGFRSLQTCCSGHFVEVDSLRT